MSSKKKTVTKNAKKREIAYSKCKLINLNVYLSFKVEKMDSQQALL